MQNVSGFPHVISVVESERIACSFKVKEDNFVAGDIVLWDGEKKIVASQDGFSLPTSGYTPIGVVVIPASHMDDNKARMMSTRWMSCDDPKNGSLTYQQMKWGTNTGLTGLTDFDEVPIIARYDDEEQGGITALTEPQEIYTAGTYCFLPSDFPSWTGETNTEDEGTRWCQSNTYWTQNSSGQTVIAAHNLYGPSPYASDGTPNPLYRATEYSGGSINNALSYFDGRHQTDVILEARGEKDYGSWKPDADIPEDYPAASCCDMYHTVGTSQGDWYLPSEAELGYVIVRINNISNAMAKIGGVLTRPHLWAWSSTKYTDYAVRHVDLHNGHIISWTFDASYGLTTLAFATV